MNTFQELGVPFPLFEAPIEAASKYAGRGRCSLCGQGREHCFRLGIGGDVIMDCPRCGALNGLDAHDRKSAQCVSCGTEVPFPEVQGSELHVCYQCLCAGRAAMTKDTEFGMVRWQEAVSGVTHGVPGLQTDQFEMVRDQHGEEDWNAVRLPPDQIWELLRTPDYNSWQGERWLFCCHQPMTYIGEWEQALQQPHLEGTSPEQFFRMVLKEDDETMAWLPEPIARGSACVYVIECKECGGLRAHWDID